MELSTFYNQTLNLSCFSPNSKYIATVLQSKLIIREVPTLKILSTISKPNFKIQEISWSPNSEYVMTACYKTGSISIFSVNYKDWIFHIEDCIIGLANVKWSWDGKYILCFSDFEYCITIWSLTTKNTFYIQSPKYYDKGFDFRKDGRYFALIERREGRDYIGIYNCEKSWLLTKLFPVETSELENLAWSPDGKFIAAWDKIINYKVLIYTPNGKLHQSFSAYDIGLGVKTVTWSPTCQFLAIGSYDEKIRLLSYYTWKEAKELYHNDPDDIQELVIWRETCELDVKLGKTVVKYETIEESIELEQVLSDPKQPNPKLGIGLCKFNSEGNLLASQNDNMPKCLWVWDLSLMKPIAFIIQDSSIRQFFWHPSEPNKLVICCGNNYVYFWSGNSTDIIGMPSVSLVELLSSIIFFATEGLILIGNVVKALLPDVVLELTKDDE
nr:5836_t:CDS:10 [Entrophospora candida]